MRTGDDALWSGAYKIPWNDPDFSERMLAEHLSQDHDLASRRCVWIDRQVAWIHRICFGKKCRISSIWAAVPGCIRIAWPPWVTGAVGLISVPPPSNMPENAVPANHGVSLPWMIFATHPSADHSIWP